MNFDPAYDNSTDVVNFSDEEEKPVKKEGNIDFFLYRDLRSDQYDNLEEYIRWHREHPHTSTPRKRRGNLEHAEAAGTLFECEDKPGMIYLTTAGSKPIELPQEYQPTKLGVNARLKEVSDIAHQREHKLRLEQRVDFDDPWWAYSVRDQASIHHVHENKITDDGSGYDPSLDVRVLPNVQTELEKKAADRERRRREREDQLAISSYWGKPTRLNQSAKKRRLKRSKYTVEGNEALGEYNAIEYEKEVESALAEFNSLTSSDGLGGMKGLTKEQVEVETMITKFKTHLGGEDAVDKIGEGFIKLATKTRKNKDNGKSVFDGGLDFLDACLKVNAAKAVPLLVFGANPNTVTEEEEPVLFMLICKVLVSDATRANAADNKDDKERKSCMKILDALATHGANLNCFVGEEKETPLHKACASGNAEITLWLLKNGANPNIRHPRNGSTPLMHAAKYAFPECVAHLIKHEAKMDMRDDEGRTALHYASLASQAKMCKFLLRLGADRDIKDLQGKTAAQLAVDNVSMTVAQTISGFSHPFKSVKEPLDFLNSKLMEDNRSMLERMLGGMGKAFSGVFSTIGNIFGRTKTGDRRQDQEGQTEGCLERLNDKFSEWYRAYQDMELKDFFKKKKIDEVQIHPE